MKFQVNAHGMGCGGGLHVLHLFDELHELFEALGGSACLSQAQRFGLFFPAATIAWALAIHAAQGAGRYVEVEYPQSAVPGELQVGVTYIMWIPEGVTRLRGVIVHQHGAGRNAANHGAAAAYDLHWQALAKEWDCALLGPTYHVLNDAIDTTPGGSQLWFDPRMGSDKAFLRALEELGNKSGHAELSAVPWILWGHSGGGIWSDVMTDLHPERVVAIFLRSGAAAMFRRRVFPKPQVPAAYAIPILANAGVKEQKTGGLEDDFPGVPRQGRADRYRA